MVANVIRMQPGPMWIEFTHVKDIQSSFELFIPDTIQKIILDCTNLEGRRCFWREMERDGPNSFKCILWGSYPCWCFQVQWGITESLWDAETDREFFRATTSLEKFHIISRIIHFNNRDTRPARLQRDKLSAIRSVWDKWAYQFL
jgi:hypothetical protein